MLHLIDSIFTTSTKTIRETYKELLLSREWKEKRAHILRRDGHKCLNCHSGSNLQVHHRQYHTYTQTGEIRKPWEYPDKYLVTLCDDCHALGHKKFSVPFFNL